MDVVRLRELESLIQKLPSVSVPPIRYSLNLNIMADYVEEEIKNARAFRDLLFHFLDVKGFQTDAEFYNKAGIDRRHFSKIKGNDKLVPKRGTVMAIIIALGLSAEEADKLMRAAGYAFNSSSITDVIVKYCIENKICIRADVDEALIHFGMKPLLD